MMESGYGIVGRDLDPSFGPRIQAGCGGREDYSYADRGSRGGAHRGPSRGLVFYRSYQSRASRMLFRCGQSRIGGEFGEGFAARRFPKPFSSSDFNIFYDAPALIVICTTEPDTMATQSVCLAAENLMLAARGMGLGSCWIGFAEAWLNTPAAAAEFSIPEGQRRLPPSSSVIRGAGPIRRDAALQRSFGSKAMFLWRRSGSPMFAYRWRIAGRSLRTI